MVEERQPESTAPPAPVSSGNQKDLVEYIAKAIVNAPADVKVTEEAGDGGTILKLEVAADDKGRIIGKQGRVAEAMRTLIRVNAAKTGTKIRLEIV
jgi:predicted RNA-binding protein YlqC (UPF0109 family)